MRRIMAAAIAAIGLAVFGMGAAQAQIASDPGDENDAMYCVYNALTDTDDYELIAEAYLFDDLSETEIKQATDKLAAAATGCAATHKLNDRQKASVSDIGIYGSAADYLSEELMFEDVPDEAIDGIYDVMDTLSDDEFDMLFEGGWRDDAAFSARLKAALIAKGIPDDDFAVETSFQILELASMAMDSVVSFMLDGLDEES